MRDYCIVTDATIDLPGEIVDQLGIEVIPMSLLLGDKEYHHYPDERELSLETFYKGLKEGMPASTSQISPAVYEDIFENILKQDRDVIYICLSSGLSGTYNTSRMVASELLERYPDSRVECVDSLCASIGEGLLVRLAAEQKAQGVDLDGLLAYIEETKYKVCHWFMVDDLEQLRRGGRISAFESVLGSALHIVPILSLDSEGKLYVVTKARGVRKALAYIKARCAVDAYDGELQSVILAHGNCPDRAELLRDEIVGEHMVKDAVISWIGPVIGSHTGTGMCALTFIGDAHRDKCVSD